MRMVQPLREVVQRAKDTLQEPAREERERGRAESDATGTLVHFLVSGWRSFTHVTTKSEVLACSIHRQGMRDGLSHWLNILCERSVDQGSCHRVEFQDC